MFSDILSSGRLASTGAKQSCSMLLNRLTELPETLQRTSSSVGSTSSSLAKPKHVMISYAWENHTPPRMVTALQAQLIAMGYDVWRDETGSSLLGPMSSSGTDMYETMGQAVELSALVILCISRKYKESGPCRGEALYAHSERNEKRLDIAYVMLEEDYTPISRPDRCNGWLGPMLSGAYFLKLFNESQLNTVCTELSRKLGETAKLAVPMPIGSVRAISSQQSETSPRGAASPAAVVFDSIPVPTLARYSSRASSIASAHPSEIGGAQPSPLVRSRSDKTGASADSVKSALKRSPADSSTKQRSPIDSHVQSMALFEEAYEIITSEHNSLFPDEVTHLLFALGVCDPRDMECLDESDMAAMSVLLKRVPRNRLLSLLSTPRAQP
jgi:hypothetical protein